MSNPINPRNPKDVLLCSMRIFEDSVDPTNTYCIFEGEVDVFEPTDDSERKKFPLRMHGMIGCLSSMTEEMKKRMVLAFLASQMGIELTRPSDKEDGPSKDEIAQALESMVRATKPKEGE